MIYHHSLEVDEDEDGWWWAVCGCGWAEGPFPGREDATDSYADHLGDVHPADTWETP